MSKKKFDLDILFDNYLKRGGVTKEQMNEVQYTETKRAFFGACGQMLVTLREDIAAIEKEEDAIEQLESMNDQVMNFWLEETKNS